MKQLVLKSDLTIVEIIGHVVVWILLILITFGLAAFVFPYYMQRFIISRTSVMDESGRRVGRLLCTIDLVSAIGNIVIWILITIVTFGLGYFVFLYKIHAHCLNHTKIVDFIE
ncbi:DUF6693 family protein [Achromobacter ruhlandii]|uniref:DUF6693 family protein n=1 Tax=Achromobacter ruhlandii TaxID=72557 RepID=UPI001581F09B|nr:DUF6693 family protein [Achromobacter ruhlandii]